MNNYASWEWWSGGEKRGAGRIDGSMEVGNSGSKPPPYEGMVRAALSGARDETCIKTIPHRLRRSSLYTREPCPSSETRVDER